MPIHPNYSIVLLSNYFIYSPFILLILKSSFEVSSCAASHGRYILFWWNRCILTHGVSIVLVLLLCWPCWNNHGVKRRGPEADLKLNAYLRSNEWWVIEDHISGWWLEVVREDFYEFSKDEEGEATMTIMVAIAISLLMEIDKYI